MSHLNKIIIALLFCSLMAGRSRAQDSTLVMPDYIVDQLSIDPDYGKTDEILLKEDYLPEPDMSSLIFSDTLRDTSPQIHFKPLPSKSLWFAALCPGLGQIYNRKYWKLPIVAGGAVGLTYAITWNNKYYVAYTNAYRDISDNNPDTNSHLSLLPPGYSYTESQLRTVLKNRQQTFRRQRDLSIIGAVGFYLICILDAYVDAELFDFDISPDLSIQLKPLNISAFSSDWLAFSCAIRF